MRVAALFVRKDTIYEGMGCECWDEARDARGYEGDLPVVAHPPCQLWGNLAFVNFKRYGGERNRPGNDQGCFRSALAAVNRTGGVLEHPSFSRAWKAHDITAPKGTGWNQVSDAAYVCEVWQSAYGHKARKRTWLYYVGAPPAEMKWDRKPGTHQVGWFDRIKPTVSKKEALSTPPEFAQALVALAQNSRITPTKKTTA